MIPKPLRSKMPFGMDRSLPRIESDPYWSLHFVRVFVRDQEMSLRFYVDQLGFRMVVDQRLESGQRWVEVAPPDGSTSIVLTASLKGQEREVPFGRNTGICFMTESFDEKLSELKNRGVRFRHPPTAAEWGGICAWFEDPDGNLFALAGLDELTQAVEMGRSALVQQREFEDRAECELEVAKQVQSRLFPQVHPTLRRLDYSGASLPAFHLGGDYFDFLDLGPSRLGLMIGDVAGKGLGAALLMSNLQAILRSQSYGSSLVQLGQLLRSANRLLFDNTASSSFASLFMALYDQKRRRIQYANCGHMPGLLLRRDGSVKRLEATATVLGLFEEWNCVVEECELTCGDVLTLYTDGVTESTNVDGEEFSEDRLIPLLRSTSKLSSEESVNVILRELDTFNPQQRHDDITLIIAKVTS